MPPAVLTVPVTIPGLEASALAGNSAASVQLGKDVRRTYARATGSTLSNVVVSAVEDLDTGVVTLFSSTDPLNAAVDLATPDFWDLAEQEASRAAVRRLERMLAVSGGRAGEDGGYRGEEGRMLLSGQVRRPSGVHDLSAGLRSLQSTAGTRLKLDIAVPPPSSAVDPVGDGQSLIVAQQAAMAAMASALQTLNTDASPSSLLGQLASSIASVTGLSAADLRPVTDVGAIQQSVPAPRYIPVSATPAPAPAAGIAVGAAAAGIVVLCVVSLIGLFALRARAERMSRAKAKALEMNKAARAHAEAYLQETGEEDDEGYVPSALNVSAIDGVLGAAHAQGSTGAPRPRRGPSSYRPGQGKDAFARHKAAKWVAKVKEQRRLARGAEKARHDVRVRRLLGKVVDAQAASLSTKEVRTETVVRAWMDRVRVERVGRERGTLDPVFTVGVGCTGGPLSAALSSTLSSLLGREGVIHVSARSKQHLERQLHILMEGAEARRRARLSVRARVPVHASLADALVTLGERVLLAERAREEADARAASAWQSAATPSRGGAGRVLPAPRSPTAVAIDVLNTSLTADVVGGREEKGEGRAEEEEEEEGEQDSNLYEDEAYSLDGPAAVSELVRMRSFSSFQTAQRDAIVAPRGAGGPVRRRAGMAPSSLAPSLDSPASSSMYGAGGTAPGGGTGERGSTALSPPPPVTVPGSLESPPSQGPSPLGSRSTPPRPPRAPSSSRYDVGGQGAAYLSPAGIAARVLGRGSAAVLPSPPTPEEVIARARGLQERDRARDARYAPRAASIAPAPVSPLETARRREWGGSRVGGAGRVAWGEADAPPSPTSPTGTRLDARATSELVSPEDDVYQRRR